MKIDQRIGTRIFSIILTAALLLTAQIPFPGIMSLAAANGLTVTGGTRGEDYTYSGGVLTVLTETELTVQNVSGQAKTSDRIVIGEGVDASLVLAGVNIEVRNASPLDMSKGGDMTLTLRDGRKNTLTVLSASDSRKTWPGLWKGENGTLTIRCEHWDQKNHVCAEGTCGHLIASGDRMGYAPGIGGARDSSSEGSENTANITIDGGIIEADSKDSLAPAIGGAYLGSLINMTVNGGIITASGGGAGIGGGGSGSLKGLTITAVR